MNAAPKLRAAPDPNALPEPAAGAAPAEPAAVLAVPEALAEQWNYVEHVRPHDIAAWLALWPAINALDPGVIANAALKVRASALCLEEFGVTDFSACADAARALLAATAGLAGKLPNPSSWLPAPGTTVDVDRLIEDYESFRKAVKEFRAQAEGADSAIAQAREKDLLWLMTDGTYRVPSGGGEILRAVLHAAGRTSGIQDEDGMSRFLDTLVPFATQAKTAQTIAELSQLPRAAILNLAREAKVQVEILLEGVESDLGRAQAELDERPFRFEGVSVDGGGGGAAVIGIVFGIGSAFIVGTIARLVEPPVTIGVGAVLLGLTAVFTIVPARQQRRDRGARALEAARRTQRLLREALS